MPRSLRPRRPVAALLLLALLLASVLARAAAPGYEVAPVPAWVQERALPAAPAPGVAMLPADALLYDRQILLGETPVSYTRSVRRALTTSGIGAVSEISIAFNPAFQVLKLHRIALMRGSTVRDVTTGVAVRLVQREQELDQGIQDGVVTALVSLEDVQVGDVLDLAYSVVGINPIFGGRSFGFLPVEAPYPVEELGIRLLAAPGRALQVRAHTAPVPVSQRKVGDRVEYSVRLRRVKAVDPESEAPAWRNGFNWLEYSEYGSWKDVVEWGLQLYSPAEDASAPAFEATYASLAAAAVDKADFVRRALRYTQEQIRYLGLEFGEDSHRPSPPGVVINRKFGDCKDKSLLFVRLLRRHGIEAAPALVATGYRDGVAAALPGPGVFDHVIARVVLDGTTYWLDGTRQYQDGRLDRIGKVDYGHALVLAPGQAGVTRMYPDMALEPSTEVEEHYYVEDFEKPVRLVITTRSHGNVAELYRYQVRNMDPEKLKQRLLDYRSQYYEGITAPEPLRVEDDADANVVTLQESYVLPEFWRRKPGVVSINLLLLAFQGVLDKPQVVTRKTPFLLSARRYISSRTYVHFPTNVMLRLDEGPVVIDAPGFRYVYQDRYFDKTYYHQAELSVLAPWIEAADVPAYLSGLRKVREDMDFTLSFRDPATAGQAEIGRLRTLYQKKGKVK
ncbi:MAG TPA: DUF3857 domain-containing protein [Moraxellaceae bacterium]|nr:DUF3857 domain-containing protein [Moraxellaceae bacterium]